MARPKMPPTPASSTEMKGQDHSSKLSSLQLTFELPPSAITPNEAPKSSSKMSPVSPTTSKLPYLQPSETVKARRRSSTAHAQKETFALPPPPTRSRKIIQMKPRPQDDEVAVAPSSGKGTTNIAASSGGGAKNSATATGSTKTTAAGKKQPSATSAAGRKIARKTAHSLIERRRRSKMNEEFAVLKGLIPACTGEMHKLAILQASIEYVRYLEDCIAKLKAQNGDDPPSHSHSHSPTPATSDFQPLAQHRASRGSSSDWPSKPNSEACSDIDHDIDIDADVDVDMTDTETASPPFAPTPVPAQQQQQQQHTSLSPTQYASPPGGGSSGYAHDGRLMSPPQLAIDHEVSAALLMLGGGRGSVSAGVGVVGSARGMSVRDLLSS
ncbi:hypothetical protein F4859DRAFT_51946 [Xylaria cf. heliscus]|nr:hypothetical protein F4859DRAFT_51946 [Xylaria cf. heliscus]